jgi:hypothetical protein
MMPQDVSHENQKGHSGSSFRLANVRLLKSYQQQAPRSEDVQSPSTVGSEGRNTGAVVI